MEFLFKPTSYKKGAAWAVGATLVWKALSFANALLLALYFGADRQTDIYFYLIMLMGFGVAFLQRLNQTVLIPEAMFLAQENDSTARQFITMWLYLYAAIALLTAGAAMLWPAQIWHGFARFGGPLAAADRWLLIGTGVLFGLQIITYYLSAVAEMYKFFKTAWLGVLNAVCPLVCLLVWGDQIGIISMVYGFLAANILQIGLLLGLLKKQLRWSFVPAWVALRTQTRQNMLTGQTLAVLDMVNGWLPIYLLSGMNAGLVSALNYCKQFTDSTTEVLTARVANVAKIEMTQQAAAGQPEALNQTFLRANYLLLILLAPLVVFSCYFAPQIVELFFKRGHFTGADVQNTVCFLRPMLFTLLLAAVGYAQNSVVAAGRKIKEGFPYALVSGLLFTAMMWVFIPHYGAFSYPYIIGAGLLIGFVLNAFLFRKEFAFIRYARPFWQLVRLTALAGVALVPAALLEAGLPDTCWIQIMGCGAVFVAVYGTLLCVAKDVRQLRQLFTNGL